jgi:hypothetical protein
MMLRRHPLSTDVLMHAYPIRMSAIIERMKRTVFTAEIVIHNETHQFSCSVISERRSGKDRRNGKDRRKGMRSESH